jgi:anthranilate phosphoribosyltransferase
MRFNHKREITIFLVMTAIFLTSARLATFVSAQQKQEKKPDCPKVKVHSPDEVKKGDTITFTANVTGGDPDVTPTYNWSISASTIESGQGTSSIVVGTKEVEGNSTITATVELGGYNRECGYGSTVNSTTVSILKK